MLVASDSAQSVSQVSFWISGESVYRAAVLATGAVGRGRGSALSAGLLHICWLRSQARAFVTQDTMRIRPFLRVLNAPRPVKPVPALERISVFPVFPALCWPGLFQAAAHAVTDTMRLD